MDTRAARPKVIGLTGGIATGKSTVAAMLQDAGAQVFDADRHVHALFESDAETRAELAKHFPEALQDGVVNRALLGRIVYADAEKLAQLEVILHPRVRAAEHAFIKRAAQEGAPWAVLDIPLLFETGADALCDAVIVTDCEPETQAARALQRPGMTQEKLRQILARQMPRAQRNARASQIISTQGSLEETCRAVNALLQELRA